jgi:hypothetical protein
MRLYRRALTLAGFCALAVVVYAAGWSQDFRARLALIAALVLGAASLFGRRGKVWRPLVLIGCIVACATAVGRGLLPWWSALPGVAALVAAARLSHAMFRRDRWAATLAWMLAGALGVQAGLLAEQAVRARIAANSLTARESGDLAARATGHAEARRGAEDARRDVARGRFVLLTHGYPGPARATYREILARDGIELRAVAGCMIQRAELHYIDGYDGAMNRAIAKRFGEAYLERAWQLAVDVQAFGMN